MTVNEALVLIKTIKQRRSELSHLRNRISVTETIYGDSNKIIEPEYDVKAVDQRMVELQKMEFELETEIKRSNAITVIPDSSVDKNILFSPLT